MTDIRTLDGVYDADDAALEALDPAERLRLTIRAGVAGDAG